MFLGMNHKKKNRANNVIDKMVEEKFRKEMCHIFVGFSKIRLFDRVYYSIFKSKYFYLEIQEAECAAGVIRLDIPIL